MTKDSSRARLRRRLISSSSVVRQSCAGGRVISGSDSGLGRWDFGREALAAGLVCFFFGFTVIADTPEGWRTNHASAIREYWGVVKW
jgi:hypothetical protein